MLKDHLGIWSCPRSRSTALLRSFEQRHDTTIFDEPFIPAYAKIVDHDNPYRAEIMVAYDCDAGAIAQRLSVPLSKGTLAVQKHITRNILPQFGTSWYPEYSVFLLRDPRDIVESLYRVRGPHLNPGHVGLDSLRRIFLEISETSDSSPLVIHSDDLADRPRIVLTRICETLPIAFSESMLKWDRGLAGSRLGLTSIPRAQDDWYKSLSNSTGFYGKRPSAPIPSELLWIADDCLPIYHEMMKHCERM